MVSKITLFEPHFDGAQFGPETIGTEDSSETGEPVDSDSTASSSMGLERPSITSRRTRIRTLVGVGVILSALMTGLLAWRRFQGRSEDEDETATDPMIEERHAEEISAE
jgi:hypothetical protein